MNISFPDNFIPPYPDPMLTGRGAERADPGPDAISDTSCCVTLGKSVTLSEILMPRL